MKKRSPRSSRTHHQLGFQTLEPKRYLASVGWDGAGLGSAELTYYVGDTPNQVDQQAFESVIEQALEVWSDVVDVSFTETLTPRQTDSLDITFASIDGSGGTLAQAYFPDDVNRSRIAGDIQFDTAENWEVGNDQGSRAFDLLQVAVHEIGHALGLEHSRANGAVLNATVSPNEQFTALDDDDRTAALDLYAPAIVTTLIVPIAPETPSTPTIEPETPVTEPSEPTLEDPVTDDDPTSDDPASETPTDEEPTADDPTDEEPTDETDPTDPDDNKRRRWRHFRRGGFNRFAFRFFRFFR